MRAQSAERTRVQLSTDPDRSLSYDLGQHFTPIAVAQLAAAMFSPADEPRRCLDLGLGSGMLSICLSDKLPIKELVGVELDEYMATVARDALSFLGDAVAVIEGDALAVELGGGFDAAILNPPYRKMSAADPRMANMPVRTPNLYAAFMCRAVQALRPGGEVVAIIPRSWMNGRYFTAFRKWLYDQCSIDRIHVFDERKGLFRETDVLQEIMLVKCTKGGANDTVVVSTSVTQDHAFSALHTYSFGQLVDDPASGSPMRIAPASQQVASMGHLGDLGLRASTGKVVDFRLRDRLSFSEPENGSPLLYPCNLRSGSTAHPIAGKKPQWLKGGPEEIGKWLIPPGCYVLVKRFSAKEEARRVVASVLDTPEPLAVENHLNVIHAGTSRCVRPMDRCLAEAVAAWLNTPYIDDTFRAVSGSTQVNAGDLNTLPVPSRHALLARTFSDDLDALKTREADNAEEICFG